MRLIDCEPDKTFDIYFDYYFVVDTISTKNSPLIVYFCSKSIIMTCYVASLVHTKNEIDSNHESNLLN